MNPNLINYYRVCLIRIDTKYGGVVRERDNRKVLIRYWTGQLVISKLACRVGHTTGSPSSGKIFFTLFQYNR